MDNFTEMVYMLENVARVNRVVTVPYIRNKTGLDIVDKGADFGQVVTVADKKVSQYLLDGGIEGVVGVRQTYSGSFSEEDDTPNRLTALKIDQIDPIDGTGDMLKTYQTDNVVSPTTLVSKLERASADVPFKPTAGMIFDILHEFAIISDGKNIGLYKVDEKGRVKDVSFELISPREWKEVDAIKLNQRLAYSQTNFDTHFMDYMRAEGLTIEQVPIGGAGIAALQVFRNYIQPKQCLQGFSDRQTIDILFNAQPDWKTWDTDPSRVIAGALGLSLNKDIYGNNLSQNASNPTLNDMVHTTGCVMSADQGLQTLLTYHAKQFEAQSGKNLLMKNY